MYEYSYHVLMKPQLAVQSQFTLQVTLMGHVNRQGLKKQFGGSAIRLVNYHV